MRVPIGCADGRLRQYAQTFSDCFSRPQFKHFVIVLMGLLLCQGKRTLTGMLSSVAVKASLASLCRFLSEAPWTSSQPARIWSARFDHTLAPLVAQHHADHRAAQPKRGGRPKASVVTGYLIGDDSTCHKVRGKKMKGLGYHSSPTSKGTVRGHSLVQSLYVLLGRRCPLEPRRYRQKKTCQAAEVPFASKVALMETTIRAFEAVEGTRTHVLLDAWYSAKCIWKPARARGFAITSGLQGNRLIRIRQKGARGGWQWIRLDDYAKRLTETDYPPLNWPRQDGDGREVLVHVVTTAIQGLGKVQVLVVCEKRGDKLTAPRFWASSDLQASGEELIGHLAARWDIEVLFADTKELLGLDQYQVLRADGLVRFWTLVLAADVFLEEQRVQLERDWQRPVSIGQAQQEVQRVHWFHLIAWMAHQLQGAHTPATLFRELAA